MEAERIYDHKQACANAKLDNQEMGKSVCMAEMLCSNACELALENKVAMMVVITESGHIARMMARQRPQATILACCVQSNVVRQVNALRGVIGYKVPAHLKNHGEKLIALVLKVAREQGLCSPDHKVMVFKCTREGEANMDVQFKILEVGQE